MKQALEAAMQHADQNSHQAHPSGQPPVLAAADRLIQAAMGFGRPYLMQWNPKAPLSIPRDGQSQNSRMQGQV